MRRILGEGCDTTGGVVLRLLLCGPYFAVVGSVLRHVVGMLVLVWREMAVFAGFGRSDIGGCARVTTYNCKIGRGTPKTHGRDAMCRRAAKSRGALRGAAARRDAPREGR